MYLRVSYDSHKSTDCFPVQNKPPCVCFLWDRNWFFCVWRRWKPVFKGLTLFKWKFSCLSLVLCTFCRTLSCKSIKFNYYTTIDSLCNYYLIVKMPGFMRIISWSVISYSFITCSNRLSATIQLLSNTLQMKFILVIRKGKSVSTSQEKQGISISKTSVVYGTIAFCSKDCVTYINTFCGKTELLKM